MGLTLSGLVYSLPVVEEVSQYQEEIPACDICPAFHVITITTFTISLTSCRQLVADDFEVFIEEKTRDIESGITPYTSVQLTETFTTVRLTQALTECDGPKITRNFKVATSKLKSGEHFIVTNPRTSGKEDTDKAKLLLQSVKAALERQKQRIKNIYLRQLRKDPTLEGKMVVEITFKRKGSVSVELKSDELKSPYIARTVNTILTNYLIQEEIAGRDAGTLVVTYPIEFHQEKRKQRPFTIERLNSID